MAQGNAAPSVHPEARRLSSVPAPREDRRISVHPLESTHDVIKALRSDLRNLGAVQTETVVRAVRSEGHNFVARAVAETGDSRLSTCVFLSALAAFQEGGSAAEANEAAKLAAALAKNTKPAITPAALMHASCDQTILGLMGVDESRRAGVVEILLSLHLAYRSSAHDSTRLADAIENIGTMGDNNQKAVYAMFCQERDRRFITIDVNADVA